MDRSGDGPAAAPLVVAREAHESPLACMVELAQRLGIAAEVAVALESLFQLTEGCLGRPLRAECCCSPAIGPDERAILVMIAFAPEPGLPAATPDIPHGLPGALAWAVSSVRRALGGDLPGVARFVPAHCPFDEVEPA